MRNRIIVLLLTGLVFLSGCIVSKKKYDELAQRKSKLELEKNELEKNNKVLSAELQQLQDELKARNAKIDELAKDTAQLGDLYKELIDQYQNLSKISAADAQNLSKQLERVANLRSELEERDSTLARGQRANEALQKELQQREVTVDSLIAGLNEREARVQELERLIQERDAAINRIRDQVAGALLKFNKDELTVEVIDGKVYVSLAADLLFASGSYNVDTKGKEALAKLGEALKGQADIEINIEGHTDDLAMAPHGDMKDNWDLSVLRATNIVRELVKAGVDPKILVPSGRASHKPKVDEKTREARAQNRRTEIIISPDLAELFKLIEGAEISEEKK